MGLISLQAVLSEAKYFIYYNGTGVVESDKFQDVLVISAPLVLFSIEGIMMLLHFLNPYCFNNRYNTFGIMVSQL